MKKNVMSIVCTLAVTVVLIASCSKDSSAGPAGPAGATGPAGPAGAAGAAGAQGPKGDTGTANVIYSAWLDASFAIDTIITVNGIKDTSYYTVIQAPKLTSAILTRGEVRVYLNLNTAANPVVFPLPYVDISGDYIQPVYGVGAIELDASRNFGSFTSAGNRYYQYRYILIPGGVPARSSINWNSYADVKAALNLPD